MRKSKFSETQIVSILKEAEAGVAVNDLPADARHQRATFFTWRSKYGVKGAARMQERHSGRVTLVEHYARNSFSGLDETANEVRRNASRLLDSGAANARRRRLGACLNSTVKAAT